MALQTLWQAVTGQLLSKTSPVVDGAQSSVTTDAYGRMMMLPITASDHGAAMEGSYYVASNGVAGAPIADQTTNSPNSAVPSDVAPALVIMNTNQLGGPNILLKRVFRAVVAPGTASQLSVNCQMQLDLGLLYTSGGTALTVKNQQPAGNRQSGALVYAGAIVKAAKTNNVLYVGRSQPRNTIAIALDEYVWRFGATEGPTSFISSTAGATRQVIDVGPVVVPPGWTFSMHFAYTVTVTGSPTSDWEVGWIER